MNKNITSLNKGKAHQPIYKVRTYEPLGNKFNVGHTGNKAHKYVEAAKGTNLFFGIYTDEKGKRWYETIPLHIVMERQKQGLPAVPETNKDGNTLLFQLSPNDLVYVPTEEEVSSNNVSLNKMNKLQLQRLFKVVSFTGSRLYALPFSVAKSVVDKIEFTQLNKLEFFDKRSIKEECIKIDVDRLGNIGMHKFSFFSHMK